MTEPLTDAIVTEPLTDPTVTGPVITSQALSSTEGYPGTTQALINSVSKLTTYLTEVKKETLTPYIPYLLVYKSHFFVPENQSKNGGATYIRGYVK